jgi:chromosome segregation ATPase
MPARLDAALDGILQQQQRREPYAGRLYASALGKQQAAGAAAEAALAAAEAQLREQGRLVRDLQQRQQQLEEQLQQQQQQQQLWEQALEDLREEAAQQQQQLLQEQHRNGGLRHTLLSRSEQLAALHDSIHSPDHVRDVITAQVQRGKAEGRYNAAVAVAAAKAYLQGHCSMNGLHNAMLAGVEAVLQQAPGPEVSVGRMRRHRNTGGWGE